MERISIGIVSLTEPRKVDMLSELEQYNKKCHNELVNFLQNKGIEVIDPIKKLKGADCDVCAVKSNEEVEYCIKKLLEKRVDCLILGCWKWTSPMFGLKLVRELKLPVLLVGRPDPEWTALGCISAIGAALWEVAPNIHAKKHARILDNKNDDILAWVRGVGGLQKMKKSSIMLWGGSYCLKMDHLRDDLAKLKSFLIGDILSEGQYMLIKRSEEFLEKGEEVNKFINWLQHNKTNIKFDESMLTNESLRKQTALYLAARKRLEELKEEKIIGVSIKCQPELSLEYGVTPCFLPAFLPSAEDHSGKVEIIPTTCEGDVKGLLTLSLLHLINPDVPPLMGDVREVKINGKDHLILANCGAAPVFYANNSNNAGEVLPHVTIQAQCQGASGGAVGYKGKEGEVTVARLVRIDGKYVMHLALGRAINVTEDILQTMGWGKQWPHIVIDLNTSTKKFAEIIASNHYSLTLGNFVKDIEFACKEAGIVVMRIDNLN